MKIVYGDLFILAPKEKIIIPHVVNNKFVASKGFVVELTKHFPQWKEDYLNCERNSPLGRIIWTSCKHIYIASMCAQTLGGVRPLYYNYLVSCMEKVAICAVEKKLSIHCPAFGSGLAGGSEKFINELIVDCWLKKDIDVTMYKLSLPPTLMCIR